MSDPTPAASDIDKLGVCVAMASDLHSMHPMPVTKPAQGAGLKQIDPALYWSTRFAHADALAENMRRLRNLLWGIVTLGASKEADHVESRAKLIEFARLKWKLAGCPSDSGEREMLVRKTASAL